MYCQSCGALHTYSTAKPNFCQKCGTKFAHATTATQEPIEGQKVEVEEDTVRIPTNLQGLDVEITPWTNRNTLTVGDLMKQGGGPSEDLGSRPGPSQEQAVQEFQKEAGSLKQPPPHHKE